MFWESLISIVFTLMMSSSLVLESVWLTSVTCKDLTASKRIIIVFIYIYISHIIKQKIFIENKFSPLANSRWKYSTMEWYQHWLLAFSKILNIPQFQRIHEMLIGVHSITVLSARGAYIHNLWESYDCSWIQKEIYDQCFPPKSSCMSDSYNDA